jgi:hypothetical protein
MWVGRTASKVFGLALVLALLFGAASMALGANRDFFKVGKKNVASATSTLVRHGVGLALSLQADDGPPLKTNSRYKVANLNADKVDGQEGPMWAVGNADGTLANSSSGVTGSSKRSPGFIGEYKDTFNDEVTNCAYSATLRDRSLPATEIAIFREGEPGPGGVLPAPPNEVYVNTRAASGTQRDHSF